MWSSTTNQTSDNKKSEDVEECRLSCASAEVAPGGGIVGQQTQQLNVFETNSKQQQAFGGKLATIKTGEINIGTNSGDVDDNVDYLKRKGKDLAGIHTAEAVDSGFISGPQSDIYHELDKEDSVDSESHNIHGSGQQQKFNIIAGGDIGATSQQAQLLHHQQQEKAKEKQKQKEKLILDSGCIEDEEEDDNIATDDDDIADNDAAEVEYEHEAVAVTATTTAAAPTTPTSASAVSGGANLRTQNEQSSAAIANTNAPMLLKNEVDAGMSERFCNLSLQTDGAAGRSQQQVAGVGMNNLNYSARISGSNAPARNVASQQQQHNRQYQTTQQQQQQAAGNSATMIITTNLTPTNAWEQFYQQNDEGDTPLHLACISGDVDVVIALLRMAPHPCLFNIQNDIAQTPLHLAALTAQPKLLRMLLLAGAEPTIRDRHGNTALHIACIASEEQCVKALTSKFGQSEINEAHRLFGHRTPDKMSILGYKNLPSDLEICNYDGERCVHLAAQAGHIEILRVLKDQGADINAREGKSGRTPLHIAIEYCNEDLANFLLDDCEKLNLETATYAGLTAYQVACILNKSQMQNILEKRGALLLTPPDSDYDSSDIETDLEDSKIYDRFGDPGYFVNYNGGNPMTVV